jgi:hypothetical protein
MSTGETHGHAPFSGPLASVRPDARDWHVAHVPLVGLSDLHWDEDDAPDSRMAPGPRLCAFTSCDSVVAGELPHAAHAHGHPHAVRVCILREDNDRSVFERLRLEAGPPPRRLRK